MITPETLKKTAQLIREQEAEKIALSEKVASFEKEARVNRTVINMLKDGLLDVDEIDSKTAEFNSNPDLLVKAASYFENKKASPGSLDDGLPATATAEDLFMAALTKS